MRRNALPGEARPRKSEAPPPGEVWRRRRARCGAATRASLRRGPGAAAARAGEAPAWSGRRARHVSSNEGSYSARG